MQILLDARTVGKEFSGVGNYVLELVQAFAQLDAPFTIHYLVHGESRLRDLNLDERFDLVEAPFSHESHPFGDIWEHFWLPRRAAKREIDVIHGPAFLIPTRRCPTARVATVHDLVAYTHPETIPRKYATYMRWLIRRAVNVADRVITDSVSVRSDIGRILPADESRIDCIPLGVSPRFSPPDELRLARVRQKFGLDRRPFLLFVGNLEPRKNLPGLVAAFREVCRDVSRPLDLAVAGQVAWLSDTLMPALQQEDLADRIRLLGFVDADDLPALYGAAEAFVFPTFWEGFGLPVLEAMASGTPVIASDAAAIPEVAGDAAVLVDPASTESVARGIRRIVESEETRAEYRRRGLERVKQFTWRATAEATLRTYAKAVREFRK